VTKFGKNDSSGRSPWLFPAAAKSRRLARRFIFCFRTNSIHFYFVRKQHTSSTQPANRLLLRPTMEGDRTGETDLFQSVQPSILLPRLRSKTASGYG